VVAPLTVGAPSYWCAGGNQITPSTPIWWSAGDKGRCHFILARTWSTITLAHQIFGTPMVFWPHRRPYIVVRRRSLLLGAPVVTLAAIGLSLVVCWPCARGRAAAGAHGEGSFFFAGKRDCIN
jgi:hypothetical protein